MKRALIIVLAFLLAPVTMAQPVQDGPVYPEAQYKGILSGWGLGEPEVSVQGPFTVLSYRIPDSQLPLLRAMEGIGLDDEDETVEPEVSMTKVYPLIIGAHYNTPDWNNAGEIETDPVPLEGSSYYYFWIAVNFGSNDLTRRTILKLKGPGRDFNLVGNLTYAAQSVELRWVREDPVLVGGVYKYELKISGRPKVKSYLCFGCWG